MKKLILLLITITCLEPIIKTSLLMQRAGLDFFSLESYSLLLGDFNYTSFFNYWLLIPLCSLTLYSSYKLNFMGDLFTKSLAYLMSFYLCLEVIEQITTYQELAFLYNFSISMYGILIFISGYNLFSILDSLNPEEDPLLSEDVQEKGSILVIDDDKDYLKILSYHLADSGYNVVTESSAEKGVGMAKNLHPQIILMDLHMPKLDGVAANHQLKSNQSTRNIPVLVMSSRFGPKDLTKEEFKGQFLKGGEINTLKTQIDQLVTKEQLKPAI